MRPLTTLDRIARDLAVTTIDVLKVDVEGFEVPALQGARDLLSGFHIGALVIEADGHGSRYSRSENNIESLLLGFGYILDRELTQTDRPNGNCIVFRSPQTTSNAIRKPPIGL